jgi:uncharacterized membrane protein
LASLLTPSASALSKTLMSTNPPPNRFRDHTNVLFEVFIISFTVLPILVLIYFYSQLPERIPEYLNLHGEVEVWGRKSLASVFRLPLMAVDMQMLCLLMKYGLWQGGVVRPAQAAETYATESLKLSSRLWDWFRALIAFKLGASSIEVIFLTNDRLHSLSTAMRIISWAAAVLGIIGAGFYLYRLIPVNRKLRQMSRPVEVNEQNQPSHLLAGIFYYNPWDPSLFVKKYWLNFANKWAYAFLLCLVCLPLLMFLPMLIS